MCCRYINEYMDTNLMFGHKDGAHSFLNLLCACKHVCMCICKVEWCTHVYMHVSTYVCKYVCVLCASVSHLNPVTYVYTGVCNGPRR